MGKFTMNLKKSDKMIAGIAVVVLIIAAIGIVLYTEDKDDVPLNTGGKEKTIIYLVEYEVMSGGFVVPDNADFQAKHKLIGDGDYHGTVDIPRQNVESVSFFVDYTDNKDGLLGIFGKDKLTVVVTDMNGNEIGNEAITGSGNITINKDDITPIISTASIEAENEKEARDELERRYADNPVNVSFNVDISLKIGEIRLLARLLERLDKDDFTLEVTYDYYDYSIRDPTEEENNPPTSLNVDEGIGTITYNHMSYGGRI